MKKFVIVVLLATLLVALVPAQAQGDDEVTLTVQTVSAPGGCLITLEEVEEGTVNGFTSAMLGNRPLIGQFFELGFESDMSLFTVGWGMIEFEGNTIFIFCPVESKDVFVYVNGADILSAENHEHVMLDIFQADYPIIMAPKELIPHLETLVYWQYVGSIVPGEKSFSLTLSQ